MHRKAQKRSLFTAITSCSGAGLSGGKKRRKDSQFGVFYRFRNEEPRLGERVIRNSKAEQPDARAWRLILLAAGRVLGRYKCRVDVEVSSPFATGFIPVVFRILHDIAFRGLSKSSAKS